MHLRAISQGMQSVSWIRKLHFQNYCHLSQWPVSRPPGENFLTSCGIESPPIPSTRTALCRIALRRPVPHKNFRVKRKSLKDANFWLKCWLHVTNPWSRGMHLSLWAYFNGLILRLKTVCEIVFAEVIDRRSRVKMIHHRPAVCTCRPVILS